MAEITLKPITADNWREAVKLKTKPGQENFVADNWYSIIEGFFDGHQTSAIYHGDTMIGLTMVGYVDSVEEGILIKGHEIIRLMIDGEHQNKGYGRVVLQQLISDLKADPACETIYIMFVVENEVSRHLYSSVGFTDTGHIIEDEVVFSMPGK